MVNVIFRYRHIWIAPNVRCSSLTITRLTAVCDCTAFIILPIFFGSVFRRRFCLVQHQNTSPEAYNFLLVFILSFVLSLIVAHDNLL